MSLPSWGCVSQVYDPVYYPNIISHRSDSCNASARSLVTLFMQEKFNYFFNENTGYSGSDEVATLGAFRVCSICHQSE